MGEEPEHSELEESAKPMSTRMVVSVLSAILIKTFLKLT